MLESVTLVVMSAGQSSRFRTKKGPKKQWLRSGEKPLWLFVADNLSRMYDFERIIVTCYENEQKMMQKYCDYEIVVGGESRQASLQNALRHLSSEYVMVTDTARCCIDAEMFERLLAVKDADCVVPYVGVSDTAIYENQKIERDGLKLIQTPQISKTSLLKEAFATDREFTDESSAILSLGKEVVYVEGSKNAKKLTFVEEIGEIPCLKAPSSDTFIGSGFDIHAFEDGKAMLLGGVNIDVPYGFKAHSDGDVLIHALIDALLGAVGAGDIGEWFPDNDAAYKGADSRELLKTVVEFVCSVGFEIVNCDISIMAEQPKISPYKRAIEESLASLLEIERFRVNLKATTAEKMGFVGRKEGLFVHAITSLKYFDWKNL